ncbi:hypothetical protein [Leptolyngbya sp. NIES-2104]|uniref:hypothetical protein n=1 Tax=Leptolyngbya sp. NIES-2104 TaxID=1552121 RepID=UPI0006EC9358|nr:hypothetical protein [Leptolyngbya sp. NIES-2104]GAP99701.1 hypothetical protein NIES2104_62670 [Leptolyngbya sp. NIES-2104]
MSYLVLSDETRKHLEQERSRLTSDREEIVSEIESSVSAEVDRTLQTLNALLDESPEVEVVPADDIVEAVTERLDDTKPELSRSRKTGTKKAKPEAKAPSTTSTGFDAKQLKRKFNGAGLSDAIVQVLQQDPTQEYETDALIAALYNQFDQAEMPKARKTLGATLMHQRRAGLVEKIGDKSPRYKLGQAAAVSA